MKLTVTEAMRLKNEISQEIGRLQYTSRGLSYGTSAENDIRVDDQSQTTIVEHMERTKNLLAISYEINSILDKFNKENDISLMVRQMKNNQFMLSMYDSALNHAVAKEVSRREKLDNKFVTVVTKFEPYLKKSEIRKNQKSLRAENRELQSQIDKMNGQSVNLTFEYQDFEELQDSTGH